MRRQVGGGMASAVCRQVASGGAQARLPECGSCVALATHDASGGVQQPVAQGLGFGGGQRTV
jgi:hypothetical protein